MPATSLAITGDLDEVPVRITDVHRTHGPSCPCLFNRPKFDLDTVRRKLSDNVLDLAVTHEAQVACPGRRDVSVRGVFRSKRVQIDLLRSEVKGVELALEHDMPHSQNPLVELDGPGQVAHGEDHVVNARNFQDWTSMIKLILTIFLLLGVSDILAQAKAAPATADRKGSKGSPLLKRYLNDRTVAVVDMASNKTEEGRAKNRRVELVEN